MGRKCKRRKMRKKEDKKKRIGKENLWKVWKRSEMRIVRMVSKGLIKKNDEGVC